MFAHYHQAWKYGDSVVKGGLFARQFFPKNMQRTILSIYSIDVLVQGSDLALFWGDWSQSENLSDIKPPLGGT